MDLIANYESDSEKKQEVVKEKSRKSYSAEFKLKVVNFTKSVGGSNHSASKKFGVDRSTVIDWVKQEQKLHNIKNAPNPEFYAF